ncbi:MAG: hypothetical protein GXP41_00440 [Chloroflexi bacterium]|nr:hypothetical protein [Chloroflexota bacterium]
MRRNSLAWTWLGGLLTMAGYWAPWVSHKSPALVLIGFDLAEFVKFTPAYRTGTLPGLREALWVPPAAAALLLALAVVRGRAHPLWARVAAGTTGFLMAFTLLPPFPYRAGVLFSAEFRGQTTLALVGMTACGAALLAGGLPIIHGRGWRWAAVPVAVLGIALPVWEFAQLKPLFDSLYGHPVTLGVGIPLTAVGLALALWGVWNVGRKKALDAME